MPTITYKATNTELDPHLQQVLEHKLQSLEKFIGEETDVKCEATFEQTAPQQNGCIYRLEINLWLKGTLHHAEATEDQFEKAIDEVRNELEKLLRRASNKNQSLFRRGSRKLKEMMRFGG